MYRINARYCVGCGACIALCPRNAIELVVTKKDVIPKIDDDKCVKCGLCASICPAIDNVFASNRYVLENMIIEFNVKAVYFGWSRDRGIRFEGASGGIVTTLLRYLLEKKVVDYVLITKHRSLSAFPLIASNVEDVVESSGSIYFKTFTLIRLRKVLNLIRRGYRVAIVGLPCMLRVVKKILPPDLRGHVILIGLMCYHINAFWYIKYIFSKFSPSTTARPISVSPRRGGWPGKIMLKYYVDNSVRNVEVGQFDLWNAISIFELTAPKGCLYCYDHTAIEGDIVVADAWHPKFLGKDILGVSLIIVRSSRGLKLLQNAVNEGFIELIDASRGDAYVAQHRNFFIRIIQMLIRRLISQRQLNIIFKYPREAIIEILRLAMVNLLDRVPFVYAYAIIRVIEKLIYILKIPSIEERIYTHYCNNPRSFLKTIKTLTLRARS
ncbi:MAG TPA: 4Fe-4S dicluster domain-containing protein [Ignisphaera sp.]|nr:4Fe-4S dicluster domain-containing protein [Ignisphaera sp.]